MKRFVIVVLLVISLSLAAVIWLQPVTIPADVYADSDMSDAEFAKMKSELLSFPWSEVDVRGKQQDDSMALYCKKIPLVMLIRAPGAKTLMVYSEATRRAPLSQALIDSLISKFRSNGALYTPAGKVGVTSFEQILLRKRDGLRWDLVCR